MPRAQHLLRLLALLSAWLLAGALIDPALGDARIALVIGNGHYQNAPTLDNPANDAADLAAALNKLGFATHLLVDATKREMDRAVQQFARDARNANLALFFFAGHGMQFQGHNYVLPIDSELKDEISIKYELTAIDDLKEALQNSRGIKVLVLDSCRDNPIAERLVRSIRMGSRDLPAAQGLAPFGQTSGMIVAYATQSDETARDGAGRNSPFSAALLKELQTPRLEIGALFRRVQSDVFESTNGVQEPELSISLVPEYYLNQDDTDQTIWARIRSEPDPAALRDFLAKFPNSFFAPDAAARLELLTRDARQTSDTATASEPPAAIEAKPPTEQTASGKAAAATVSASLGHPAAPALSEADILKEARERLYELNFDPGAPDGPVTSAAYEAIRDFETQNKLPPTGVASMDLLRRLRDAPRLKPWGAIVFDRDRAKWGMAWGEDTRKAAVANAKASCGGDANCSVEVSFFGSACGVFAHSALGWAIDARADIGKATDAAVAECSKRAGGCRIVASVCADGSHRSGATK